MLPIFYLGLIYGTVQQAYQEQQGRKLTFSLTVGKITEDDGTDQDRVPCP